MANMHFASAVPHTKCNDDADVMWLQFPALRPGRHRHMVACSRTVSVEDDAVAATVSTAVQRRGHHQQVLARCGQVSPQGPDI